MLAASGLKMANKQTAGLSGEFDASIPVDTSKASDQNSIGGIKSVDFIVATHCSKSRMGRATRADNQAEAPCRSFRSPPDFSNMTHPEASPGLGRVGHFPLPSC